VFPAKEHLEPGECARSDLAGVDATGGKPNLDARVFDAARRGTASTSERARAERRSADDEGDGDALNVNLAINGAPENVPKDAGGSRKATAFPKRTDVARSVERANRILKALVSEGARSYESRRAPRKHSEGWRSAASTSKERCRLDPIPKDGELRPASAQVKGLAARPLCIGIEDAHNIGPFRTDHQPKTDFLEARVTENVEACPMETQVGIRGVEPAHRNTGLKEAAHREEPFAVR
jgi:hypothetical protein